MSIIEPSAIDGISYIPSDSLASAIRKLTLKENRAFAVTDIRGEIPRGRTSELGVYFNDTRHLNTWETLVNGCAPVPLAQEQRHQGTTWVLSMTNRDLPVIGGSGRIPRDTLLIRRILTLHEDTLFEIFTIRNFSSSSQTLQLEHWAGARFEDVFEVRGMKRPARGTLLPAQELAPTHWSLSYRGLDGAIRNTHLHRLYPAEKIRISPYLTGWITRVEIQPKEILTFRTVASFNRPSSLLFHGENFETLDAGTMMSLASYRAAKPALLDFRIESDNALFNRSVESAICDVSMLLSSESDSLLYPYAGIPWFSAPFGRDGLITAYQLLPWAPKVARGVLEFVFSGQGKQLDRFTEEEPGKIFHELRRGEMAALREIPFVPYFGSVDATPLTLILLHEYACWTSDRGSVEKWWPAVEAALEWMDRYGDIDGDHFLEYVRKSERGLSNQGWKDSHDSVMHDDGTLADAPIRLCEVQAYAYRARLGAAELASWLGKADYAERLRFQALRLRTEFQTSFWDPAGEFVYLALDGSRRPCKVRSSNMGHCLWSGILSDVQAEKVSKKLLSESMFSGHGIRTLADTEEAYNPMSYHNGSIWPHDNSIIAQGLHFYGRTRELQTLGDGLFGVLESSEDFRLPELFCGFRKRGLEPPIPYEVACKPQAWSAGALFLVLRSMLGLERKLEQRAITLKNPMLLGKVRHLMVSGIEVGGKSASISFRRGFHGVVATNLSPQGSPPLLVVRTKSN
jgi:glycogen debranching enzyme